MRLWVLGSGSRGNAVLLESAGTRVLVDAGFAVRDMEARLGAIGVTGDSIEAVLVTHEHTDHVRGAAAGARRWGWSLYATRATLVACPALAREGARSFDSGDALHVGDFRVQSIATPHDAAEPVAFVATAQRSGARAAVAYDFGHATAAMRAALGDLDVFVLEANHDPGMLRAGPYPPSVRHRIAGSNGHLSNPDAAALARSCAHGGLAHVVLAHLSDSCNDAGLATTTVRGALRSTRFRGEVCPAPQDGVVGPFGPGASRRGQSIAQLALDL